MAYPESTGMYATEIAEKPASLTDVAMHDLNILAQTVTELVDELSKTREALAHSGKTIDSNADAFQLRIAKITELARAALERPANVN